MTDFIDKIVVEKNKSTSYTQNRQTNKNPEGLVSSAMVVLIVSFAITLLSLIAISQSHGFDGLGVGIAFIFLGIPFQIFASVFYIIAYQIYVGRVKTHAKKIYKVYFILDIIVIIGGTLFYMFALP